jgi:hypothetical protein
MNNIREKELNKNVIQVYTEEVGFTGYKGFEFHKIDDIESILQAILVTGNNISSGIKVYISPTQSSTISNSTVSQTNGTVLAANASRLELYIQNLATGVLYVKYGTAASSASFNFILAANTASNAGDGGSLSDQTYTGVVSVSGINSNYISWEKF